MGVELVSKFGYVYLIGSHVFGWYKIGKSKTPHIRLENIGILLPFKIEVFAVLQCLTNNVEASLHKKYQAHHINGEWFRFTMPQFIQMMQKPVENAVLIYPSAEMSSTGFSKFRNVECDAAPEGKSVRVIYRNPSDPLKMIDRILATRVKQALKNYPLDCD